MGKTKNILIVAGEVSGDLHAANLVEEVKRLCPDARFFGLGGEKLKKAGVELYVDIVGLAVVGFFEVLKNLDKFKRIFRGILKETDKVKPDLAVLVDYPGFNLRLAEELNKRRIPVVYYISPQVWAWGEGRINTIKRVVKRIIVLFKFEEDLYQKHDVPVSFVGHPLLDMVKLDITHDELLTRLKLNPDDFTIALLPGSREKEVKQLLPVMLEAARLVSESCEKTQFLILRSSSVKEEVFAAALLRYKGLNVTMITDKTYDGLASSDFALVASGTATLETAILGVPMAILYKVSFLTWAYIKALIKIPNIGLANIVAGERVVPEFLQYGARPKKIALYIKGIISNRQELDRIRQKLLSKVKGSLGEEGASRRAAEVVAGYLRDKT